jgi:TonB family protein
MKHVRFGTVVLKVEIGYLDVMISRISLTFAATILLFQAQLFARDWGYVSGWYVTSADQSCGMYSPALRPVPGSTSTELLILKRMDGAIYLQAKNSSWSVPLGSEEQIQYQIDGRTYAGAQKTVLIENAGANALMAAFGADFETEIRSGTALAIVNNGRLIGQIPLSGTSSAFAALASCLSDLRANGNGNAPAAGFASLSAATSVAPKGDVSRWISLDDYPGTALREGREGTVGFRLAVGNDGKVFGCTITKSSGHTDLDEATCTGMTKRAKFDAAKDANGTKVAGSYQSRVSWKLPN